MRKMTRLVAINPHKTAPGCVSDYLPAITLIIGRLIHARGINVPHLTSASAYWAHDFFYDADGVDRS